MGASAAAGAAFMAFHPFVLHELQAGRPTQAVLAPAIGALALAPAAIDGDRRAMLQAGALLALSGWFYWFTALFTALGIGVLALGRPLRRVLALGAVAALLVSPVAVPLLRALAEGRVPGLLPLGGLLGGQTVTAEGSVVPIATVDLLGRLASTNGLYDGEVMGLCALGGILLAPGRWRWAGVLGLVLAIGPHPFGVANPIYAMSAFLFPPMLRLYWPVRAVVLCAIAAVPALRGRWGTALAVGAVVEGLARGWAPLDVWDPGVAPIVERLADLGEGAVIVLPTAIDQRSLVDQTVHGKPTLGGMNELSRGLTPPEVRALREGNGWLSAVLLAPRDPRAEPSWSEADKEALHALGYRWIILRLDALAAADARLGVPSRSLSVRRRLSTLAGPPVLEDERTVLYAPWETEPIPYR
jgi:hypothetical protein